MAVIGSLTQHSPQSPAVLTFGRVIVLEPSYAYASSSHSMLTIPPMSSLIESALRSWWSWGSVEGLVEGSVGLGRWMMYARCAVHGGWWVVRGAWCVVSG